MSPSQRSPRAATAQLKKRASDDGLSRRATTAIRTSIKGSVEPSTTGGIAAPPSCIAKQDTEVSSTIVSKRRVRRLDHEHLGAASVLLRPLDARSRGAASAPAVPSRAMLLTQALLSEDEIDLKKRPVVSRAHQTHLSRDSPYPWERSPTLTSGRQDCGEERMPSMRASTPAPADATERGEPSTSRVLNKYTQPSISNNDSKNATASRVRKSARRIVESSEDEDSNEEVHIELGHFKQSISEEDGSEEDGSEEDGSQEDGSEASSRHSLSGSDDDSSDYEMSNHSDSSNGISLEEVRRRPRPLAMLKPSSIGTQASRLHAFSEPPQQVNRRQPKKSDTKVDIPQAKERKGGSSHEKQRLTKTRLKPQKLLRETSDLAEDFSHLSILPDEDSSDGDHTPDEALGVTPCLVPGRENRAGGLTSPKKPARIPKAPSRPSNDLFWDQDFMDDWNDQHSPQKSSQVEVPPKSSSSKKPKVESKKSFEARKTQIAEDFLSQLDARITQGRLSELAASTGGIKIVWSKTLNTTAGRANWKRETIRIKSGDGNSPEVSVEHKHHASIELAVKVIDEEDRLLNVLAHEFCHLANFMINGITGNPHGREFKTWAAKCSRAFAAQGIHVTTKHTYEIDFKYVWTCEDCKVQYKRHSKSIDPSRHRCGTCKGLLAQTKPVPRGAGAGAKPSEYQQFMKDHMKIVKAENPGSPQKEVMRIVADRWSKRSRSKADSEAKKSGDIIAPFVDLTLEAASDG